MLFQCLLLMKTAQHGDRLPQSELIALDLPLSLERQFPGSTDNIHDLLDLLKARGWHDILELQQILDSEIRFIQQTTGQGLHGSKTQTCLWASGTDSSAGWWVAKLNGNWIVSEAGSFPERAQESICYPFYFSPSELTGRTAISQYSSPSGTFLVWTIVQFGL